MSEDTPILGSSTVIGNFSALKDGDQFIISTDTSGDTFFTYCSTHVDPVTGYFNNMQNLSDAINTNKEYNSRLIDGQLYITPQNFAHSMTFKNASNENNIGISSDISNVYGQDHPKEYLNSFIVDNSSPIYSATKPKTFLLGYLMVAQSISP